MYKERLTDTVSEGRTAEYLSRLKRLNQIKNYILLNKLYGTYGKNLQKNLRVKRYSKRFKKKVLSKGTVKKVQ